MLTLKTTKEKDRNNTNFNSGDGTEKIRCEPES